MSVEQLNEMVVEQLGLLADACHSFDAGTVRQVKSISARLFIICHDIVRQADWKEWSKSKSIIFTSTFRPRDPHNMITSHTPLTAVYVSSKGASFQAIGSSHIYAAKLIKISKWWDEVVIELDNKKLSRKNIVFQMRNKDGGSHGNLEQRSDDYSRLSTERGAGFVAVVNGEEVPFRASALEATVRQIAHEALVTFIPHLSSDERRAVGYDPAWSLESQEPHVTRSAVT